MPASWSAWGWLHLENIPCNATEFLKYVRRCDKTPVLKLLDAGVRATALDDDMNTALILACERCRLDDVAIVAKLLEKREVLAELGHKNRRGYTAYMAAHGSLGEARKEILELLIAANAPKEKLSEIDLVRAVAGGMVPAVDEILRGSSAPDVNAVNSAGQTPLLVSIENDSLEIASRMIARGADVNRPGPDGKTPLMVAAERGSTPLVELLLKHGAAVDTTSPGGSTALILAAWKGRTEVVRLLVEVGGADVTVCNQNRQTALMGASARRLPVMERILRAAGARGGEDAVTLLQAANRGDLDSVRQQLAAGCDPDVRNEAGDTPLMIASARGWTGVVDCLLDPRYHASVNAKNQASETALFHAASAGHLQVVESLLRRGAQIEERNQEEDTALIAAARLGRDAIVELLLRKGAFVDARGKDRLTPLMQACQCGSLTAVQALLAHGARAGLRADVGNTACMIATLAGHTAIVNLLHRKNLTRGAWEAQLFLAASRGLEASVVKLLQPLNALKGGQKYDDSLDMLKSSPAAIDLDARDLDRRTALTHAAAGGWQRVVEILIAAGATVDGGDLLVAATQGEAGVVAALIRRLNPPVPLASRALLEAAIRGHSAAVEVLLMQGGADVNFISAAGDSALILGARRSHLQVVEVLLRHGADLNLKGRNGNTALMAALIAGHMEVARLLVEKGARAGAAEANLLHAVRNGNLEEVKRLLAHNPDLRASDLQGRTALMIACEKGHDSINEALLDYLGAGAGAFVNDADPRGITPLMLACRAGSHAIVTRLLRYSPDAGARSDSGRTALIEAAWSGNLEIVTDLIERSADVNATDENGNTPLREALASGNIKLLGLLESRGAVAGGKEVRLIRAAGSSSMPDLGSALAENPDLEARARGGKSALMLAASSGWVDGVIAMIQAGAKPNAHDSGGRAALSMAAGGGHNAAVLELLKAGADPNGKDRNGRTALIEAAAAGHLEAVRFLLEAGANPNERDRNGSSALMLAVASGQFLVVRHLMGIDSLDLEAVDDRGRTAAMLAHLDPGASDIEALLLAKGLAKGWNEAELLLAARDGDVPRMDALTGPLDLEAVDLEGNTALLLASRNGHAPFVRRLLDAGASPACRNRHGRTALLEAVAAGSLDTVDLLLESGADVGARHGQSGTALLEASQRGAGGIVARLLRAKADPNARALGQTPLTAAAEAGSPGAIQALISAGARIDDSNGEGRTALMCAASAGQPESVALLIVLGADLDAVDHYGASALDLAVARGHSGCADLLRKAGAQEGKVPDSIVVITATGRCYHTRKCHHAEISLQNAMLKPMQESQAVAQAYERCEHCRAGIGIAHSFAREVGA